MKVPIYLDNNSTTPVDPRVFSVMKPYFLYQFGNASSKHHSFGWEAKSGVENARKIISEFINGAHTEIIFTSGATESINLAHFGIAESHYSKGKNIITSNIEHNAVNDSLSALEKKGFTINRLKTDKLGLLNLNDLEEAISPDTILVSIMTANNEIGTINNIEEIGNICKKHGVLFHTDATQAIGKTVFDVQKFNIDLASFSSHKIYGPKGVGALYVRNSKPKVRIIPQFYGGGQEKRLRPGTYNVPGIVGFGKAVELLGTEMNEEIGRIRKLRDKLYTGILSYLNDVSVNGDLQNRLPGNINLSFKGIRAENLMMNLKEIAVSTGAACSSESMKTSHVLKAIGLSDEEAGSAIRFGIGRFNNEDEIAYTVKMVVETVKKLRALSPTYYN